MNNRTSAQIRREFIEYFQKECCHTFVPSSPCVPQDDPTLMFTNAGMNQFKPIFLGQQAPDVDKWSGATPGMPTRAANTQKCIRAGGKHNDLDDVGHDTYHHTFFEMLGNWSFGDYFKKEAIAWAWDLLTNVWGLDPARLHATYFEGDASEGLDPDTEARDLWRAILPAERVHPGNKKDNFWEMGDTGPCGPCSEIHIDLTPDKSGGKLVNAGDARVMEIWNLVFIQYAANWKGDGESRIRAWDATNESERAGKFAERTRNELLAKCRTLTLLPAKHVDTGMGFERITSVIQGMQQGKLGTLSNYDTDVFAPILDSIQRVTGAQPYSRLLEDVDSQAHKHDVMKDVAYRVVADHIRTLTFALTDGAVPSNEGRGFVLRRILRRAVRYGRQYLLSEKTIVSNPVLNRPQYKRPEFNRPGALRREGGSRKTLSASRPFLCDLVPAVASAMGDAFPELHKAHGGKNVENVASLIREEEVSFIKTLDRGIELFESAISNAFESQFEKETGRKLLATGTPFPRSDEGPQDWSYSFSPIGSNPIMISDLNRDEMRKHVAEPVVIPGAAAFRLHDTYGFPIDLTQLMAVEKGLTVDTAEYERLMKEAKEKARTSSSNIDALSELLKIPKEHLQSETNDSFKYTTDSVESVYLFATGLIDEDGDNWTSHGLIGLVFDRTSFYAEQGGQVGDTGYIQFAGQPPLQVATTKRSGNLVIHLVNLSPICAATPLEFGKTGKLVIDAPKRRFIEKNHTATHIMNWALRETLGDHVQQKGSLVDDEKTRFDLSHNAAITEQELAKIESLTNEQIKRDLQVFTENEVDQAQARQINTLRAVFGEKYPEKVRVVSVGAPIGEMLSDPKNAKWMGYSVEFCGGTHVKRTGEIGRFRLIEESAVSKGIRRVVGITGQLAEDADMAADAMAAEFESALTVDGPQIAERTAALTAKLASVELPVLRKHDLRLKLGALQEKAKQAQKDASKAGTANVMSHVDDLLAGASKVGSISIVCGLLSGATADQLRVAADSLRAKSGSAAVLLASDEGGKATLLAAMTPDVVQKGIKAGDLIKEIAPVVGGKGGGRPDMAQGGGPDAGKIADAVSAAQAWLRGKLS